MSTTGTGHKGTPTTRSSPAGRTPSTRTTTPASVAGARAFVENYEKSATGPCASLGHWVGMATHDVGQDCGPLRPGMVFTIEPALVVPEEKIYIRLEDMIVVGESRADILTTFVP